jgi:DNA-binding HxlR family transcriptional regulator
VRSYGQYCPIARASEILAERWTPIILRNLLNHAITFNELAEEAPGIPRSLLATRLRQLERVGVVEITSNPSARGYRYRPTAAGAALRPVLEGMGAWAERWLELGPEHADPGLLLRSWCKHSLARDQLPEQRIVVRFEFPDQPVRANTLWFVFDGERSEICRTYPGFAEDIVVAAEAAALAEWHLGRLEWTDAVRAKRIRVSGPPHLTRALPLWHSQRS